MAPTFVRGYLRSYARLLNLAAQPIIDAFDRRGLEPPALIPDISTSEETTGTDAPMRLATASIIIMLLAGWQTWWNAGVGTNWLVGSPDEAALTTPAQPEPANRESSRMRPANHRPRGSRLPKPLQRYQHDAIRSPTRRHGLPQPRPSPPRAR